MKEYRVEYGSVHYMEYGWCALYGIWVVCTIWNMGGVHYMEYVWCELYGIWVVCTIWNTCVIHPYGMLIICYLHD